MFNGEKDAMDAILKRKIQEGDVVVIRDKAQRGRPACRRCSSPTSALMGLGYARVALVTDGRFSGGTRGPCVGTWHPEAAAGGPLGLVKEGDRIQIDLYEDRIDLLVTPEEMEKRKRTHSAPKRT